MHYTSFFTLQTRWAYIICRWHIHFIKQHPFRPLSDIFQPILKHISDIAGFSTDSVIYINKVPELFCHTMVMPYTSQDIIKHYRDWLSLSSMPSLLPIFPILPLIILTYHEGSRGITFLAFFSHFSALAMGNACMGIAWKLPPGNVHTI